MVYVTRRERFSSAHKLYVKDWSEEKNMEIFGKCANPNWHGHNFELYVTAKGEPDKTTGFAADLSIVSKITREHIIKHLDHKNINLETPFMKGINPTIENLTIAVWNTLQAHINNLENVQLHRIKIQETENNYAEYFGEE